MKNSKKVGLICVSIVLLLSSAMLLNVVKATPLTPPDYNADGHVDFRDIIHFVDTYIQANGGVQNWDTRCDFTVDGQMTYADIVSFVNSYVLANTPA